MFDPNPATRDLTLDDVDAFLGDNLEGKALDHAREALRTLWKIPTKFPAPGGGGFSNNVDNVLRGLTRARLASDSNTKLKGNGQLYASGWFEGCYGPESKLRDEQHRHLRGVYNLLDFASGEARKRVYWALGQHNATGMGIQKLEDFVRKDFPNLRTFMRAAENSMIGACWLKDQGRGDEARDIASRVAKALDWFYSLRFTKPADDYPHEVPGWGLDVLGIPFHVDRLGRGGDGWNWQKNGLHIPWQVFMMQPNALDTIASAMSYVAESLEEFIDFAVPGAGFHGQLQEWFWSRAYNDSDDPMHRGFGQTAAFGVFRSLDPLLVARPQEIGIPTGEMLWTPWLMARNDEDVRRMLEALVVQGEAHWGKQNYGMQLLAPEFLEHVAAKKKEQQPDPEPQPRPIRSKVRDQLANMVKNAKREGWNAGAKAVEAYGEMLREPDDKQAARMLRDARRAVRHD